MNNIQKHIFFEAQLLKVRFEKDHLLPSQGEDDLLDEMEKIYVTMTDQKKLELENERMVKVKGPPTQASKDDYFSSMAPPDVRNLDEVRATADDGPIKKGQQGFAMFVRVFVPLNLVYEGKRLWKCYDKAPDSTFWEKV